MRVSMSPSGSVIAIFLPARLRDARDQAFVGEIAEHDPRQAEFAIISAAAAGQLAAVADPRRVRIARQLGHLQPGDHALGVVFRLVVRDRLQLRVFRRVLLDELLATLVLVDRTQFRHDLSSSPKRRSAYAACCASASTAGNGKLNRRSSSRASSSVLAVVVIMTSMPR